MRPAARLVDASGVAWESTRPPRRIVSLVPSTTELVCDLGLADALVGVSAYCREPRGIMRTKARVGGEKDPDLARIRALEPDLVIANIEENLREHVEALRAWGLPVWVTYPRTVAGLLAMVGDLGLLTGSEAAAALVAGDIGAAVAAARAWAAGRPRLRVFYAIWRAPWMTVGGDTYISDVLATAGGVNIFADRLRYPAVTLAEVAARHPDVIVLPDEPFRFRRAHVRDFAPYRDVPAVRDGRVHLVDGKPFSWHGRRLVEACRLLPALLSVERPPPGSPPR